MISYCAGEIPNDWKLISFSGYSRSEALRYWIFLMSFLWRRIKPPSDTRCFCPSWRPAVIYSSVHIPARSKRVPCLSTTDGDKMKETLFCHCSTGIKTKFSRETSELFDSRHWAVCPAEPDGASSLSFPTRTFLIDNNNQAATLKMCQCRSAGKASTSVVQRDLEPAKLWKM